jgi:hypothetical protein
MIVDAVDNGLGDVGPIEGLSLLSVQRLHILAVLQACDGDRLAATRILQIGQRTLYYWIDDLRRCGVEIPRRQDRPKGRGARRHERAPLAVVG